MRNISNTPKITPKKSFLEINDDFAKSSYLSVYQSSSPLQLGNYKNKTPFDILMGTKIHFDNDISYSIFSPKSHQKSEIMKEEEKLKNENSFSKCENSYIKNAEIKKKNNNESNIFPSKSNIEEEKIEFDFELTKNADKVFEIIKKLKKRIEFLEEKIEKWEKNNKMKKMKNEISPMK